MGLVNIYLGVIWKNGQIINHRSLLKVVFNPLLRLFGFQFSTQFKNNNLGRPVITRCSRVWVNSWYYNISGCTVEKKRRLF